MFTYNEFGNASFEMFNMRWDLGESGEVSLRIMSDFDGMIRWGKNSIAMYDPFMHLGKVHNFYPLLMERCFLPLQFG